VDKGAEPGDATPERADLTEEIKVFSNRRGGNVMEGSDFLVQLHVSFGPTIDRAQLDERSLHDRPDSRHGF